MLKDNSKGRILPSTIGLFLFFLIWGCMPSGKIKPDPNLPHPGFEIEDSRSDPNRSVREYKKRYKGPIYDTHVHLDPPERGVIREESIQKIVETINEIRVDWLNFMPTPNEGQMRGRSNGANYRKTLRKIGGKKIRLFCGSEYISNWLDNAYHSGYKKNELNKVLDKLSQDLDDPECLGIGELGLYHFNKTGKQNIIEYPPTFAPFLKIIGLIAKKDKWVDLHAEPVNPYGKSYENQVFGGLALLFQKYPKLKLILSHTAMTNPTNVRRILKTYPNIMMNFKPIKKHHLWKNLEPITDSRGRLYNDWAKLFEEMPERFMVGTDEKFGRRGKGVLAARGAKVEKYGKSIKRIRKILGSINKEAAQLIAYGNAERIFK